MAQAWLYLDGKPFRFHDYPFAPAIYDVDDREILLKTGRQVSKSTTCANVMIVDSARLPHFKTLYITPSRKQTSQFSNTRLTKIIHHSPLIRSNRVDPLLTNNVFLQIFSNGAEMSLSYALDDPDRIRGISADRDLIDEVQDILYDAVIPVVKECLSASNYAYVMYAGTPKTMENTIEFLWQKSSKSEWIMKCDGCGKWQFVETEKSIGKKGIVCLNCDKYLNPRHGQWYDFNPEYKHDPRYGVKGFHVSQPILPANVEQPERWKRILEKLESYSPTKFKNEVLGVSDAVGSRLITLEELTALCEDYMVDLPIQPDQLKGIRAISGGVDWSGQGQDYVSRTVVWVFGLTRDYKLKTLFYKIMKGENPVEDVDEVGDIFQRCNCQVVIGDAGEGAHANAFVRDKLGAHRMFQAQYGSFQKMLRWNRKDRYLVDRTSAIDSYMIQLKRGGVIFPNIRQMATPIQDILNEYEETTQVGTVGGGRRVWRHAPTAPDDCLHAQIFAWFAMKVIQGDLEFYEPEE
jgi:hypothetical protein